MEKRKRTKKKESVCVYLGKMRTNLIESSIHECVHNECVHSTCVCTQYMSAYIIHVCVHNTCVYFVNNFTFTLVNDQRISLIYFSEVFFIGSSNVRIPDRVLEINCLLRVCEIYKALSKNLLRIHSVSETEYIKQQFCVVDSYWIIMTFCPVHHIGIKLGKN